MFESVILPAIISLLTASVFLWLKSYLARREQRTLELQNRTRESFQQLLEWHSDLFISFHISHKHTLKLSEEQVHIGRKICLWASDQVVFHYARSLQALAGDKLLKPTSYEIELANAILAFRKNELRFKNKRLTPEHIITIFKGGYTVSLP
jgi:hypothetical protein